MQLTRRARDVSAARACERRLVACVDGVARLFGRAGRRRRNVRRLPRNGRVVCAATFRERFLVCGAAVRRARGEEEQTSAHRRS
jgi:plasmid stabilization system protein ParE